MSTRNEDDIEELEITLDIAHKELRESNNRAMLSTDLLFRVLASLKPRLLKVPPLDQTEEFQELTEDIERFLDIGKFNKDII
jgi:hypothetical protein